MLSFYDRKALELQLRICSCSMTESTSRLLSNDRKWVNLIMLLQMLPFDDRAHVEHMWESAWWPIHSSMCSFDDRRCIDHMYEPFDEWFILWCSCSMTESTLMLSFDDRKLSNLDNVALDADVWWQRHTEAVGFRWESAQWWIHFNAPVLWQRSTISFCSITESMKTRR